MPRTPQIIAWLMLCVSALSPAWAQPSQDKRSLPGPAIGTQFPETLALPDQSGNARSLKDIMGRDGVTVVFVRSVDWCPYCKRQIAELNVRADEFERAGYPLASVSVDTVALVAAFADAAQIKFTMLADAEARTAERLGIRDTNYASGSKAYGVPRPGIFIIDRSGQIRAKFFEAGYVKRVDAEVVLASIRAMPKR